MQLMDDRRLRVRQVAAFLASEGPPPGPAFPCPYLKGREARNQAFRVPQASPGLYHVLMDLNFRRSGLVYYRPSCEGCHECRAIRLPVADFVPSRAQRRCLQRNADLRITQGVAVPSEEKLALYRRYLAQRHDGQMEGSEQEYLRFLCDSCVETVEVCYRDAAGHLLGVATCDVEPAAMSAVYCFFEPSTEGQRRSLGVFNVLWSIGECARRGLPYLYLGYNVADNPKMAYKRRYRPHELLAVTEDGGPYEWEAFPLANRSS